ncbi:MAG: GntR family transcriptional regulator [Pseudomonadota bacterium]
MAEETLASAPTALPKYQNLAEMLIREIAAGRLPNGSKLPPERIFASQLGVAIGTLRKALDVLVEKGLIERIQGSGNYVRAKGSVESIYSLFRLERLEGGGLPSAEILTLSFGPKPARVPTFGPSEQAHRIRRLRFLDDRAIAMEEIFLDASAAPDRNAAFRKEDLGDALYLHYKHALGVVIARVEDRIGVAVAPAWSDPRFGPSPGTQVGFVERVSRLADGAAIEFSRTWFDPNEARYINRF